jgi:trehalose 6-phosphate synthase/phosphatase
MPGDESTMRMRGLRQRVAERDVHTWASSFLEHLEAARPPARVEAAAGQHEPVLTTMLSDASARGSVRVLLDYDGTLVPIVTSPELAAPDEELQALLAMLAGADRVRVEIVSGRSRDILDSWFGHLPISLWAEHGFWYRPSPAEPWQAASTIPSEWLRKIEAILQQFADNTPGAQVERKGASVAWHYRRADGEFGARQAHELRMLLGDTLSNQPLEVVEGKKVIEVRLRGVSKALVARRLSTESLPDTLIVAIGDDRTDEDLFRALPPTAVTIAVGDRPARASHRVEDYRAVRRLLRALLRDRPGEQSTRSA